MIARAAIGGVAFALVLSAVAAPAHAFQNPDNFVADALQAGGGGRFFTGSPVDSYTCEVCHTPRQDTAGKSRKPIETATARVYGLPETGYLPGVTYRVTVDWPDDLLRVALTMELTDREGRALGVWSEPDPATLTIADRCALMADTPTGVRVIPVAGERAVVSAIDCGQLQITMNWTAPAFDPLAPVQLPDALFSGALVASNTNGGLAGDATATFARNLAAPGAESVATSDVSAHCNTVVTRGTHAPSWLVALWILTAAAVRFRRALRPRRALRAR